MGRDDVAIVEQRERVGAASPRFRSGSRRSGRRRSSTSGRAALSRSTVRTAWARLWRRFIRLRIRSSPACSDRWKCGISRGSPATSSNSALVDLDPVERGQAQALQSRQSQQALAQRPEAAVVAGDVDPGEDDFLRAARPARGPRRRAPPRRAASGCAPRACQIEQKVQRWSQPVWTATKLRARARKPAATGGAGAVMTSLTTTWFSLAKAAARYLSALPITLVTSGIAAKLAGSSWAAQPVTTISRVRAVAAGAADRLAGLAHRLVGDRAAVDDDQSSLAGQAAHRFALGEVQPAAQGNRLGHQAKASRSISPSNTWVAVPRIRIGSPGAQVDGQRAAAACAP